MATDNRAQIERFFEQLYAMDYEGLAANFGPDSEYTDVASPPDDVARGPDEIVARLRLALEPLEAFGDERRLMVADGDAVVTEHVELWRWPGGETMALPVVSVHELRDGTITRWWDYWDMAVLVAAAPGWWFEHVMKGYK
ncbi:MAG TPA: nuclear transport factor 2 family protein [Acidimicrobiales bacterium]|nr:nuclear transport factor 2 family protein [Acidimicrobiales bacterium]